MTAYEMNMAQSTFDALSESDRAYAIMVRRSKAMMSNWENVVAEREAEQARTRK